MSDELNAYYANRVYNLWIMKKLWQRKRKKLCDTSLGIDDPNSFYKFVNMSKETLRKILNFDTDYDIIKIKKHANEFEERTGVPHEYLTGEEYIKLPKLEAFENDIESFMLYGEKKRDINTEIEEVQKEGRNLTLYVKNELERLEKHKEKDAKAYEKAYEEAVKIRIKSEAYTSAVEKSLSELCMLQRIEDVKDKFLFRLMYYITYNTKYEEIGVDRIIEYMNNMDADKLSVLSDEMLAKYMATLYEQVEIVRDAKIIKKMTNFSK